MARNRAAERAQLLTLLSGSPANLNVFVEANGQVQLVATGPGPLDRVTVLLNPQKTTDLLQFAPLEFWQTPASTNELLDAIDNCWISVPDEDTEQAPASAPLLEPEEETHDIINWLPNTEPDVSRPNQARLYFDNLLNRLRISENGQPYVNMVGPGAGGGQGWIYISDIVGVGATVISNKIFQDAPNNTVLQSCAASATSVGVVVKASYPLVTVDGNPATLTRATDMGHYEGQVNITLGGAGVITARVTTPDGDIGATDDANISLAPAPELTSLSFTGGYPGSQTELKAGDTYQITGTTSAIADAIEIQDFGASDAVQLITFPAGLSFTVTMTIGDRGTTAQLLSAQARARDPVGAFGAVRDTNAGGGGVNGTDVVNLNNLGPSFVDGGTTFPGGQTAFKGVEVGSQDTTVNDFDTVVYADPTGTDFSITSPATYAQIKTITCLNPGTYNDSVDNFRITANRAANDFTNIFTKQIEVADVAPILTVTQPQARLRSGGNDGTAVQSYLITATSNQNLAAAPDVGVGVDGTFVGGGFVGGPKIFTRSLNINDNQTKGTGAWILNSPVANGAGLTASITGTQNNGGFVQRSLTYAAFATSTNMSVAVVDFSKLTAGIFTATGQTALKQPIGTSPPVTDGYTIDATGINPTAVIWLDTAAAGSNSGGTAQITDVEETV